VSKLHAGWWRHWLVTIAIAASYASYSTLINKDLGGDGEPALACIVGTSLVDSRMAFKFIENPDYANPPLTLDQWTARHVSGNDIISVMKTMTQFKSQSLRQVKSYYPVSSYQCASWLRLLANLTIAFVVSVLIVSSGLIAVWVVKGFKK
jgi:hypothetical protein